jgi:hypothetical protein
MTKIGLDGPSIDAVVGQLKPAGVAQHVRVDLHIEPTSLASALDHRLKATLGEWRSTLRREQERRLSPDLGRDFFFCTLSGIGRHRVSLP